MSKHTAIVAAFTLPRSVAVVAADTLAARAKPARKLVLEVAAEAGSPDFGSVRAALLYQQARATACHHAVTVSGDEMRYSQSAVLGIYDKTALDHPDVNTLRQVV